MIQQNTRGREKPAIFDTQKKTAQRNRIAHQFDSQAFLHPKLVAQALDRLSDWGIAVSLLDWGCHTGQLGLSTLEVGLATEVEALDSAPQMVQITRQKGLTASIAQAETPLAEQTYDRLVSIGALHWVNNLPLQLRLFYAALKPGGYLLAALPGGGSLNRLRTCLLQAETHIMGGASPRLSPLPALKDCGRLLQMAGYSEIMVDRTEFRLRYSSLLDGLRDLRSIGEQAAFFAPHANPLSRRILLETETLYRGQFADPDGRLPAQIEYVWLTARRPF